MYPGHYATDHPDRPCFIMAETGETVTYAEYEARTNRLAHLRDELVREPCLAIDLRPNRPLTPAGWVHREFGGAKLGDRRLQARLLDVATSFFAARKEGRARRAVRCGPRRAAGTYGVRRPPVITSPNP